MPSVDAVRTGAGDRDPGADTPAPGSRPTAGAFYAVNRGGGLFSEALSQRLGASFAVAAERLGVPPTVLTLANVVLGVSASVAVAVLAPSVVAGELPAWLLGLPALLVWQLAYALDCADGQLARVTGRTSPAGARADVLADVLVQISLVTAVASAAAAYRPDTPAWLVAVFAGTWMVNLVTSVMQSGAQASSLITRSTLPVRLLKLVRDYGAVLLLCGLVLAFAPAATLWLLAAFSLVNGGFLLASVLHSARTALRASGGT